MELLLKKLEEALALAEATGLDPPLLHLLAQVRLRCSLLTHASVRPYYQFPHFRRLHECRCPHCSRPLELRVVLGSFHSLLVIWNGSSHFQRSSDLRLYRFTCC